MSKTSKLWNWYKLDEFEQRGKIIAEYIWIDGSGHSTRSKCWTFEKKINSVADLPEWNYDGSSTG